MIFKRLLSIFLTLCVLFSLTSILSVSTVAAESPAISTNIALGATADRVLSCDSTYASHPGYRAFDGINDDANKWAADGATNGTAWLIIDLGKTYDITKVRPYIFEGSTGKRVYYYNVYVAEDGDFEGEFSEANKATVFEGIKANGTLAAAVTSTTTDVGGVTSNINLSGRYVLLQFVGSNESNTISLYEFEIFSGKDDISDKLVVTCYGDSMTEGMGFAVHERYPSVLQTLLGDDYLVQNCGDRGERTTDIMARQGGMPIFTKNDITFPAGEKRVQIGSGKDRGFIAEDGRTLCWTAPFGRDLQIDKVEIGGVTYRIKIENFSYATQEADTYLVREGNATTLEEVTIPANSKAVLDIITTPKNNYCDIYFMGFNGGYSNIDELVAQYQRMIDYRGNDRYLIVIPFIHWNKPNNQEMYTKFKAAFGDHAVDLIEYVQNGAMEEAGLTVTDTDREEMELGLIPVSLRLNETSRTEIHLNAKGYNLLANLLYEQGVKIGLFGGENGDDDTSDDSTSSDTSLTTNKNLAFVDETNQEDIKRVIASHENIHGCGVNAFDGKITDDNYDKWWAEGASGSAYLIIDLGDVYNINGAYITTLLSGARKITYDAYTVSSIGNIEYKAENKEEIAALIKAGSKFILNQTHESFRPYPSLNATGRYVLIEVTRSFYNDEMQNPAGINIVEVEIYGYKFVSTEAEIDDANKTITIPSSWTGATVEKFLNDVKVKGNASVSIEKSSGSTIADGDVIKVNHIYTPGGVATEKAPTTYTVKIADEEEPPYAGDTNNAAPFVAVIFFSVLALAVTAKKVFKEN